MLEQVLYRTRQVDGEQREQVLYMPSDLEKLSVTEFHTAPNIPMGGFGGGFGGGGGGGSRPLKFVGGRSKPLDVIKSLAEKQTKLTDYGIGKLSRPLVEQSPLKYLKYGNIAEEYKFPEFTLQERIDAKDPKDIHLNYDLLGFSKRTTEGILKDFHKIRLFDK